MERFRCAWAWGLLGENPFVHRRQAEVRKNNVTFIPGLPADDKRAYGNGNYDS